MKQYFYSYHVMLDGRNVKWGHGSVVNDKGSFKDAFDEALREIGYKKGEVHMIAFSLVASE